MEESYGISLSISFNSFSRQPCKYSPRGFTARGVKRVLSDFAFDVRQRANAF